MPAAKAKKPALGKKNGRLLYVAAAVALAVGVYLLYRSRSAGAASPVSSGGTQVAPTGVGDPSGGGSGGGFGNMTGFNVPPVSAFGFGDSGGGDYSGGDVSYPDPNVYYGLFTPGNSSASTSSNPGPGSTWTPPPSVYGLGGGSSGGGSGSGSGGGSWTPPPSLGGGLSGPPVYTPPPPPSHIPDISG